MRGINVDALRAVVRTTQGDTKLSSKVLRDYKNPQGKTISRNVRTNGVSGYYWEHWDMYAFNHCVFDGKDFHSITEEEWYGC